MDYFELFGYKPAPVVDKASTAKKYFELQKKYHPDFYTQADDAEKEQAMLYSAAINKALNIFKSEDKTLEYFLKWKGCITDGEKYNLPPHFLMEVMEMNESIDEQEPDAARELLQKMQGQLMDEVKPILQDELQWEQPDALYRLKEWYYKKKYLQRILDRLAD